MTYYLEDHPNPNTGQFGWPRTRVSGVVGVHTTESGVVPSGADPGAENTAAFIARRTDYGSYHMIADWDTIVPMTRPSFAAWADTTNNAHALSVSGAMNAARWRDLSPERAAGIVRNMGIAAAMLVRDAIAHGLLSEVVPARRITAQEAVSGSRAGFYGHGETNPGTRYDPGQNFDWDLFLATYAAAVGGGINYQSTTIMEDFMATMSDQEKDRLLAAVDRILGRDVQRWIGPENQVSDSWVEGWFPARSVDLHDVLALHQLAHDNTAKVLDAVRNIPGVDTTVIDRLGVELEARLDQSMKGLRVTLVPDMGGEE